MSEENNDILSDLDAMTAALEEPVGTPPPEDPPTDLPPAEDPSQNPPQDPPPEDPPADPPPEEDPKDVEIRMLREQIEKLSKPADPPPSTPKPEPESEPEVTFADQDFMADIDLEEVTRDPKLFNGLLNKVFQSGMKSSIDHFSKVVKKSMEDVVKSIPDIVKNTTVNNAQAATAREKFYKDNPDLEAWRPSVAAVFAEVAAANQGKSLNEVMGLTATETRRRLGLKKEVKNNPNPPKLPNPKGGDRRNVQPDPTALEAEMDAMDQALGL